MERRREGEMNGLSHFESAVLAKLLSGDHPILAALRLQAERARLVSRDLDGSGFYCDFAVPSDVPPLPGNLNLSFGDVTAKVNGLKYGAGFVVFVRDGYLVTLEGYCFEDWPDVITDFELISPSEPRDFETFFGI
jgi:hypothetical protein